MEKIKLWLRIARSRTQGLRKALPTACQFKLNVRDAAAVLVGVMAVCPYGFAATYYVDAERGNDQWTGKLPAAAGSPAAHGPWQTLGRLATAPLIAGDTVYLACGSVWNETLQIRSSGTSGAPIVVSAGPDTCQARPAIDGAVAIPSHMWQQHHGSIYRARLPIEYISNPVLSENLDGWRVWSPGNDASISPDTHCAGSPLPCMEFVSGGGGGHSVVLSNSFPLTGGVDYRATARLKAPPGTRVKVVIRRDGPPYETLTAEQHVVASGGWQAISFTLGAFRTATKSRLDIEVPNGGIRINISEAHVQRALPTSGVVGLFVDGAAIRPAHHPNFEQTSLDPNSPYVPVASAGGKTAIDTAGLTFPAGASLTEGLSISIRTDSFALEERKVATVDGSRINLDRQTQYPHKTNHGYFLAGALWMLDSPGEWYFDPATGDLYAWMPDGTAPRNRVSFNSLSVGANLQGKAHVDLVAFDIKRVGTGVQLRAANTVRLQYLTLSELGDYGIHADNSRGCTIEQSSIANTGLDAVSAAGWDTTGFTISGSRVLWSGALARTDGWRKLPRPARAAINVGPNARIVGNEIRGSANNGIFAGTNSSIEENYVGDTCLRYNDCGGIYANYAGNKSSIVGNLVENVMGDLTGLPAGWPNQAVGIYLDDGASDVEVRRNTVTNAEYGIQIHNANNTTVSDNLFFGNRRFQIWFQEQTKAVSTYGDIFGHRIESNILVPTASGPSVFMESEIGDTRDFAVFSNNHYSALLSPRPIAERWPTGSNSYSLNEWQAEGQDITARVTQPSGYASFLSNGVNIVPNGDLAISFVGWTWWNLSAPHAQVTLLNCERGPCLQLKAGASPSVLASPNFSVYEKQWYRVSFDASTSREGQPINVVVRRGGGESANYETLMPTSESFPGSTEWRRYSFVFQATETAVANNPASSEPGARLDFEGIQPGSSITVARLEILPLKRSEAATQLRLQANASNSDSSIPCSEPDEAANLCEKFVQIKDGSATDWSALLAPRSGNAVYTRDTTLLDTDHDGVADVEDVCPETPPVTAVNARGCGYLE